MTSNLWMKLEHSKSLQDTSHELKEYFLKVSISSNKTLYSLQQIQPIPNNINTALQKVAKFLLKLHKENILTSNVQELSVRVEKCCYWNTLLQRLGIEWLCDLFLNNTVVIPVGDSSLKCYVQVSGAPLYFQRKGVSLQQITAKHINVFTSLQLSQLHRYTIDRSALFCHSNSDQYGKRSVIFNSVQDDNEAATQLMAEMFPELSSKYFKKPVVFCVKIAERLKAIELIHTHNQLSFAHLLSRAITTYQENVSLCYDLSDEGLLQGLLSYSTSTEEVMSFVRGVVALFPDIWWSNSKKNKQLIMKALYSVVSMNRSETITIRQIIQGLKVSEFTWLRAAPKGKMKPHPPPSQSLREEAMLCMMLRWFIERYLIPLLKRFFHITERNNSVVYYQKHIWKQIVKKCLYDMVTSGMMSSVSQDEVSYLLKSSKTLGVTKMKFQLKTSGIRRIVNMSGSCVPQTLPVNKALLNLLPILQYEVSLSSGVLGSSVNTVDDVYLKWKQFVTNPQRNERWLVMSCDAKSCYDSIDNQHLIEIMGNKLTQSAYIVRKFAVVKRDRQGNVRSIWKRVADAEGSEKTPTELINERRVMARDSLIIEQPPSATLTREKVLDTLQQHLTCNILKINCGYYKQNQGIPQGSVLSSILCSFYYAEMEREHMQDITDGGGLFMRMVDDFLLVTSSPVVMSSFYTLMTSGVPEYQCQMNTDKTFTNFIVDETDGEITIKEEVEWFPWCGVLIRSKSPFEVRADYSRYTAGNLREKITKITQRKPFKYLLGKLVFNITIRCKALLLDGSLLSEKCVARNVYENFLVTAMKFHCYVKDLLPGNTDHMAQYLKRIIIQSGSGFHNTAVRACQKGGEQRASYKLAYHISSWLLVHAFGRVLKRKQSRYKRLILLLQRRMKAVQSKLSKESLQLLETTVGNLEGSSDVLNIKY